MNYIGRGPLLDPNTLVQISLHDFVHSVLALPERWANTLLECAQHLCDTALIEILCTLSNDFQVGVR
jgi:hypothetical protein